VDAIYPEPLRHANGQITWVDNERCFPYFSDYHGCSICIKVCPFNLKSYNEIKRAFLG
jgi:Fe-S-cluster-containing dehydrogenase component